MVIEVGLTAQKVLKENGFSRSPYKETQWRRNNGDGTFDFFMFGKFQYPDKIFYWSSRLTEEKKWETIDSSHLAALWKDLTKKVEYVKIRVV